MLFRSGELIRWIDDNNVCHDNDRDNHEYLQREEKYLSNAEKYAMELNMNTSAERTGDDSGQAEDAASN